jgi:hypothetical protein
MGRPEVQLVEAVLEVILGLIHRSVSWVSVPNGVAVAIESAPKLHGVFGGEIQGMGVHTIESVIRQEPGAAVTLFLDMGRRKSLEPILDEGVGQDGPEAVVGHLHHFVSDESAVLGGQRVAASFHGLIQALGTPGFIIKIRRHSVFVVAFQ